MHRPFCVMPRAYGALSFPLCTVYAPCPPFYVATLRSYDPLARLLTMLLFVLLLLCVHPPARTAS